VVVWLMVDGGLGFRVWGSWFGVQGLGVNVLGLEFRVPGSCFRG
jgi:hypothetical protein